MEITNTTTITTITNYCVFSCFIYYFMLYKSYGSCAWYRYMMMITMMIWWIRYLLNKKIAILTDNPSSKSP